MRGRGVAIALSAACGVATLGCSGESFSGGSAGDASAPRGDGGPAGGDGGAGGISCGDTTCHEPEICCADPSDASSLSGTFGAGPRHCSLREKCPSTSVAIACDSPTFCASDGSRVCCVSHQDRRFTSTDCVAPSGCDVAGPHDIMCIPGGAACPTPATCTRVSSSSVQFDNFLMCVR